MNVRDLILTKWNIKTFERSNPLTASIGTSAVRVLKNDPSRLWLGVWNLSTNSVYMLPDETVTTTNGIRLAPSGGAMILDWESDGELQCRHWYAIASGATSAILVLERIISTQSIGDSEIGV